MLGVAMPGEVMMAFARALNADGALLNGLIAALGDTQGDEAIDAFVVYAHKNGFPISREEARSLRRDVCGDDDMRD